MHFYTQMYAFVVLAMCIAWIEGFSLHPIKTFHASSYNRGVPTHKCTPSVDSRALLARSRIRLHVSDWSSFQALDDDDEIGKVDTNTYAAEEDPQEYKASIGASLQAPEIERPADPIFVPAGTKV
jgi:hypothetical protein